MFFPGCDRTQSVLRKTMVCRESCLEFTHSCGQAWAFVETLIKIDYPDDIQCYYKMAECEFPYRNAGDSPECWYFNRHASIQVTYVYYFVFYYVCKYYTIIGRD